MSETDSKKKEAAQAVDEVLEQLKGIGPDDERLDIVEGLIANLSQLISQQAQSIMNLNKVNATLLEGMEHLNNRLMVLEADSIGFSVPGPKN